MQIKERKRGETIKNTPADVFSHIYWFFHKRNAKYSRVLRLFLLQKV